MSKHTPGPDALKLTEDAQDVHDVLLQNAPKGTAGRKSGAENNGSRTAPIFPRGKAAAKSKPVLAVRLAQEHTPGPWQIDNEAAECQARITADGEPIADVFGLDRDDDDGDEANANVDLIAVSPDMLTVLEPIADLYDAWIADDSGIGDSRVAYYASGDKSRADKFAGISLTREQVLEIVALVAKAKGGAA